MFRVRYRVRISKPPPDPKHPPLKARTAAATANVESGRSQKAKENELIAVNPCSKVRVKGPGLCVTL